MSRRKKKPSYNPRTGGRKEIFSAVQNILRCEDKWKDHAERVGLMIEQEREAVAKLEDEQKKAIAAPALERMYAAFVGWLDHYNKVYADASVRADQIGTSALALVNTKDIKWKDIEMMLIEPTTSLAELEAEMTNMLLTATSSILPAIAEYQLKTGEGKDNADIAAVLEAMQANAAPLPEPAFEAVDEDTTREDRAEDAFERASAQS